MSQNASVFHLKVQRVEQVCLFELSWGQGQRLNVEVPFPEILLAHYQQWNTNYLSFYKTALRGRVAAKGNIAPPPVDWHAKLVEAEAKLLYEFYQWLRSSELYEIRSTLAQAVREGERHSDAPPVDVFLSCNPLDLARLPWEAWEIGAEFAAKGRIRIVRTPLNIQGKTVAPLNRDRKARVLVILGDDTGLNFQADREAVKSLYPVAEVEFVGWQPGKDIDALKAEIVKAITDERGWEVLFFAGHSNETALTGGELAIAPGVSLFLNELAQPLTIAKERGLQFALFNSCSGLSLANSLINLGLSQVAVMREPVHNRVAQEFLVPFLQCLAEYKDVHEALQGACQYLKLDKHLTYPSAYLIPSLFRHPDAQPFHFKPFGFIEKVKGLLPNRKEAIALGALVLMSWQLPVQSFLLEQRVLVQALYRQLTHQVPLATQPPPVLLVQIDEKSVKKAKISVPHPLDRSYMADLINKLSATNAKVIGLDYLLDRHQQQNDQKLAEAIRNSVQKQETWFVFASKPQGKPQDPEGWDEALPELAHPNWSLQGDMRGIGDRPVHIRVQPTHDSAARRPTLAYLLALAHQLNVEKSRNSPSPQLQSSTDLLSQVKTYVAATTGKDYKTVFSPKDRLQPLTTFSYWLKQMWLQPIFDFSIPPEQVYKRIPAWQLLETPADSPKLRQEQPPVVLIAPGGYEEAGVLGDGKDNLPLPAAVEYWRSQATPPDRREVFLGGEAHAYMVHHFLNQRIVIPIPDPWLVVVAALLGKVIALALENAKEEKAKEGQKLLLFLLSDKRRKWMLLLSSGTGIYGLASLQLYISAAVVLPWVLPTATLWSFVLLALREKKSHS
ncbi:MAG TPA: CHASE2 domain-containing protein [Candidatus Sericytochromatia bacterium]